MAALGCEDAEKRQQLLDHECGEDSQLREAVETLLEERTGLGEFLERPAAGGLGKSEDLPDDLIGSTLGPFTLVSSIGEGGGGTVYLAEQTLPVKRQVALKILKLGLDTKSVIARFEAERQTLARMDHPHIARVIDAGATKKGRPYFVMEYVPGDPVTDYCNKRQLPVEDRLAIFINICQAIEHAHQKGVIHRDIKPSNILVREQEGRAVPKVIDFGVAKATNPLDGDPGGFTMNETIIGTPAYMSPEQANRGNSDIDTRTDIYSLGVILYELLSGATPLRATSPELPSAPEVLKILNQVDPPRPSTFLRSRTTKDGGIIGRQRQANLGRLAADLQGDLDWIVMKCLMKERSHRYGSANELGRDIELYLKGAPVTARPPSWRYRIGKFVGRNRATVAFASILVTTLITAAIISVIFGLRATKAEALEAQLRVEAERDRELAINSAEKARLHQYVANINLAHQALLNGNYSKALLLLEPWATPESGKADLRGFEWWFLMEKSRGDDHFTLPGFNSPIDDLAFSSDGKQLAIAAENLVHIWSLERREITATYQHDAKSVSFTHTNNYLIASGRAGVKVIDLHSEFSVWDLEGRDHEFAISPDDILLATSDRQGVILWNTSTWEQEQYLPGASGSLAFSPNGKTLATESRDGVTVWPLNEDSPPVALEESPRLRFGENQIHYSPDGKFVVIARNANPTDAGFSIGIWDVKNGKEVAMLPDGKESDSHNGVISALSFNKEGSLLATSSWDHSVALWDFEKGSLQRNFQGHRGEVWSVALAPAGNLVASGSKGGEVRIWPITHNSRDDVIAGDWTPLGFAPDGKTFAAYDRRGIFATFDAISGLAITSQPISSSPESSNRWRDFCVNPELNLFAEEQSNGSIKIHNLENQTQSTLNSGINRIESLSFSPDGQSIVVTSRSDGLSVWNLQNLETPIMQSPASSAHFSSDGSTLVIVQNDGTTTILDAQTFQDRARFQLTERSPGSRMALSPDGKLLAATRGFQDYENIISLRDTASGEEIGILSGHKQGIWSLAFSPDGKTLASSGSERTIRLWNIATKSELLTIKGLSTTLTDLNFSPNGETLISRTPGFFSEPKIRLFRAAPTKP